MNQYITPCPDVATSGPYRDGFVGQEGGVALLVLDASIVAAPTLALGRLEALDRRYQLQGIARGLLPDHRVARCLRLLAGGLVEVYHHAEYQTATYGGLQTCGSVHVCSCCGAKIAERRAQEVGQGVAAWSERGSALLMATFTLQHAEGDTLESLASALNEAYRHMRMRRDWRLFEQRIGLVGSITAREYTHGVAGWHPHLHALLFVAPLSERKAGEVETWLQSAWSSAIAKFGKYAHPKIGVTCRLGNAAAGEYVTKVGRAWTIGDELAKANRKLGRRGGATPPQLLWSAGHGDNRSGRLFQEYAAWTYRKNALVWSPGLRQLLGLVVNERSDEEVAGEQLADGRLLVVLHRQQWRVILANDVRAELLHVASVGDLASLAEFLAGFGLVIDEQLLAERLAFVPLDKV